MKCGDYDLISTFPTERSLLGVVAEGAFHHCIFLTRYLHSDGSDGAQKYGML
jgi:hypothetical protein